MDELIPQNRVTKLDSNTKVHQLREPVPVELQGEFFNRVRKRRQALADGTKTAPNEQDLLRRIEQVLETYEEADNTTLMLYFVSLACCESVEALRFAEGLIERETTPYLHNLALMAELEVRMHVYEDLTGEPQAIIASGLGGVGELIRLSGIAMQRYFHAWEPYQRELLHQTLQETCQEHGGYIEDELWGEEYFGFCILLPYYADIPDIIESFLNECNQYGQFLHPNCHVGNMYKLTHDIMQSLVRMHKYDSSHPEDTINTFLNNLADNPATPNKDNDDEDENNPFDT